MRGVGFIIAVIWAIFSGFHGLKCLFKMRRYIRLTFYVLVWIGYPFIVYNLFMYSEHQDQHSSFWLVFPLFFPSGMWLFFGFIINNNVKNIERNIKFHDKFSRRRRIIGMIVSIMAALAWIGGYYSYYVKYYFIDMLGAFIIPMVFWLGFIYIISGRPYKKWDD